MDGSLAEAQISMGEGQKTNSDSFDNAYVKADGCC